MIKKAIQTGEKSHFRRSYNAIPDILDYLVVHTPNRGATYISPTGQEEFIDYTTMKQKALQYLHAMQTSGIKQGDIVMVETTSQKEYHLIFWACMYGGMIITPLSQPTSWLEGSEGLEIVKRLWSKLDRPIILTDDEHGQYYESIQRMTGFEGIRYIKIGDLKTSSYGKCCTSKLDDIAYIQFSSGTTGDPKGAMLTNENILNVGVSMVQGLNIEDDDVMFSWLPHTHNFGIFIPIIVSMMATNNMYYMEPSTFVSNPALFVKKLSEHKGTWTCFNNFGISWLANQLKDEELIDVDLSSLKYLFAGAENISSEVIDCFVKKYEKCNIKNMIFRPGYGLTEATLAVSVIQNDAKDIIHTISRHELAVNSCAVAPKEDAIEDKISLTSIGTPLPAVTIRIVDEKDNVLNEDEIGEIQLACGSIYKGYYGSTETEPQNIREGWLCTGDLGYYHRGLLYIVGRKKDVIIIRGVNYMITDLEELIYKKIDIQRGMLALTSVMNEEGQEEPIVFIQYKDSIESFMSLKQAISDVINENIGVNLRLVLPVNEILKTNSGKIRRYFMKLQYESGVYKEIYDQINAIATDMMTNNKMIVEPENKVQAIIRSAWATVLNKKEEEISVDESFVGLGGQSVEAYKMLGIISENLNIEISHDIIVHCRTIKEMESYLENLNMQKEECIKLTNQPENVSKKVAITGIGFKLPKAHTQQQFWNNLCSKTDSIQQVSKARRELVNAPEWNDWLGELEDIDKFDNEFFEIPISQARFMDPQQRLAMEVAYEALTDAGMVSDDISEKCIGIYAGTSMNGYFTLVCDYIKENGMEDVDPKTLIGNMNNIIAAQISHQYNFTGPVMAIDTACSTFMTAVHFGAKSILNNETSGSLIIGTNIITTPFISELAKKAGIISSTNKSKVFDNEADGSILGEGIVVLYLESLESAVKNNKNIYGVICGSAINNDGFALSVMAPNPKGQYKVLEQAYKDANMLPSEISYFEAHGTGTKIGDPIEINALSRLYSQYMKKDTMYKISIGSVKTNIGHLLPTAGGAGIIKVLLCLKHKKLVPSLHMQNINPLLQIEKTPFEIVTEVKEWKGNADGNRVAGISSLGLGGTNAHIIISEWNEENIQSLDIGKQHLLTVSAKTEKALIKSIHLLKEFIENQHPSAIRDICFTANRYRRHYKYRAICIVKEGSTEVSEFELSNTKTAIFKVNIYVKDIQKYDELVYTLNDLLKNKVSFVEDASEVIVNKKNIALICIDATEEEKAYFKQAKPETVFISGSDLSNQALLLEVMKILYLQGLSFDWKAIYPKGTGKIVSLPAYPFEKNSIWINK